jgi:ethanolamine ammonia-lyase small subunit
MSEIKSHTWFELKQFTEARIALGRTGVSLKTQDQMEFQLAHASARDAVHTKLDINKLQNEIKTVLPDFKYVSQALKSSAKDRTSYLQRPDLGRILNSESQTILKDLNGCQEIDHVYDLVFVIADGLSAQAVQINAPIFFQLSLPILSSLGYKIAPICIVEDARVAIGDEISLLLKAKMVLVLIGERPGLSAPDSMGIYITWNPEIGCTNEHRNCISNIRPKGLSYIDAFTKLHYLINEGFRGEKTGVSLKEDSVSETIEASGKLSSFLLL